MSRQLKPYPIEAESQSDSEQPEQYATQTFAEHAATYKHKPLKGRKNQWIIISLLVIVVLIAGGGGAAYWWHKQQVKSTTGQRAATINQPGPKATTPTSNTSQTYTSTGKDLNLSFTYPSSWTATPASGDNASDQAITLNSPLASITDASNTSITGKVVVTIRPGSADLSELSSGSATAAQASVQFAYSKPTAAQHQYPYLTFIHLTSSANPNGGFEEVVVTGINQFTKGQSITADSLGSLDPIISASFYNCSTQTCTSSGATPLSITNATWQDTDIFKQVQALFQSLRLN